mmetsp:Transcript_2010/g.3582  ORF Transcript_2010/g.3582 Transcript_2010/m.3582 type:complete len:86 (+) Transcript_2010:79-336(+)|eukprot:CAMPEP_0184687494 /NCGR_PEP_ID=MMETSP0312-20130426/26574_1 /TAXON_ID=31354 /ORGANISM="Compsopogon coeruleus, Strain SAG 36.94" /LENGTH=85 /DNA_ID=CAMNT_0027143693 /DNA_START=70 /DNA_END=327 /DNA_ORIENTATION=-
MGGVSSVSISERRVRKATAFEPDKTGMRRRAVACPQFYAAMGAPGTRASLGSWIRERRQVGLHLLVDYSSRVDLSAILPRNPTDM